MSDDWDIEDVKIEPGRITTMPEGMKLHRMIFAADFPSYLDRFENGDCAE